MFARASGATVTIHGLERRGWPLAGEAKNAPDAGTGLQQGRSRMLLCFLCGHPVTSLRERCEVDGAHEHKVANPYGIVFRIACFRAAPGCSPYGEESGDFSWFAGYTWQIAVCRGCSVHLGWSFRQGEHVFFGLIRDRLLEGQSEQRS